MNVLLHELQDATIAKGDTITEPKFVTEHGELGVFDKVIANPPWNQKKWNKDWVESNEPFQRFLFGLPPANRGDWTWIQLMLSSLNATGTAGVVMDTGILFRGGSEEDIRKEMIEKDLISAVIGLPENLFYNTSAPGCVLIINKNKPKAHANKVHFIFAEEEYGAKTNQNYLRGEDISRIVDSLRNRQNEEGYSRHVSIEEIRENNYNLNIARYIDTARDIDDIDIDESWSKIKSLEQTRGDLLSEIEEVINGVNNE
jgi:type I restriction enzyme M protein